MTKKILVACGTAMATSTVVAKKIEKLCKENNLECIAIQCKADEVLSKARTVKPNVIVSTAEVPDGSGVTVVNGNPFLTGIDEEKTADELLKLLKS